ncbi:MAG: structural protein P5 [Alistipes sp.]|nr:structural protein P5 [Alistipes sp.]
MSRGLRNRNPGNIRRSAVHFRGEVTPSRDAEFKEFSSMAYGYRAMFVVLDSYRRRYGRNTIRTMIERYAPPTENFTDGYVRFITRRTGIAQDEVLDTRSPRDMIPVVAAMSEIENGTAPVMADIEAGWELFTQK